uniref:Ig-like domain-containing protein n=1 Tax=Fundulus heteroclitus TaxID=8078 RepID=A0A3Q2QTJ4_FUNHE
LLHTDIPPAEPVFVSVYEGSDVQLTCNLRANYLPANDITWFNNQGVDVRETSKYIDAEETQDSGEYRCSTSNAVGGAEVNVTLVVKSKNLFSLFFPSTCLSGDLGALNRGYNSD